MLTERYGLVMHLAPPRASRNVGASTHGAVVGAIEIISIPRPTMT